MFEKISVLLRKLFCAIFMVIYEIKNGALDCIQWIPNQLLGNVTIEQFFKIESAILTILGAIHILIPMALIFSTSNVVFPNAMASALDQQLKSRNSSSGPQEMENKLHLLLEALTSMSEIGDWFGSPFLQALGGCYILIASTLCTAASVATPAMCTSLSAGHVANVILYIAIHINSPLTAVSWNSISGLLHATLAYLLYRLSKQQQPQQRLDASPTALGEATPFEMIQKWNPQTKAD